MSKISYKNIYTAPNFENEYFSDITENEVPGVKNFYQISTFGRVFNKYMNIILKPGVSGSGYLFVELSTLNG